MLIPSNKYLGTRRRSGVQLVVAAKVEEGLAQNLQLVKIPIARLQALLARVPVEPGLRVPAEPLHVSKDLQRADGTVEGEVLARVNLGLVTDLLPVLEARALRVVVNLEHSHVGESSGSGAASRGCASRRSSTMSTATAAAARAATWSRAPTATANIVVIIWIIITIRERVPVPGIVFVRLGIIDHWQLQRDAATGYGSCVDGTPSACCTAHTAKSRRPIGHEAGSSSVVLVGEESDLRRPKTSGLLCGDPTDRNSSAASV